MANEQWLQERNADPSLQEVEIFVTQSATESGRSFYEGNIYSMPKYQADRLKDTGKGEIIDVPSLKTTSSKMEALTSKLQGEIKGIQEDARLSDVGRSELIEAVLERYQVEADAIQERYSQEIDALLAAEGTKVNAFTRDTSLDPYEIRTQAGLVASKVTMARTFDEAIKVLEDKISTIDSAVARELSAQFVDIKRELEAKRTGQDPLSRTRESMKLTEIYEKLEDVSLSPEQKRSMSKYKMLQAIAQQRRNEPIDTFNRTKKGFSTSSANAPRRV